MAILEEWESLQQRKAYVDLQLQKEQQDLDNLTSALQANLSITNACEAVSQPPESGEFDKKADLAFKLGRIISGLRDTTSVLADSMLPQIKDELTSVAVAAIAPAFGEFCQLWKPLEEPKPSFVDGLLSIRRLFGLEGSKRKPRRRPIATPYETMMYKMWLPAVAKAVREWKVRDPDELIAVFDAWEKLMPGFIRAQLLDQDIVRKLEEAVQKWQPRKDQSSSSSSHTLPHSWIFPWLPYLPAVHLDPKSSTGLVADVKRKFRQLIEGWEYSRGAIPGLKQWKDVLRPSRTVDQWGPLVMNHVLPSMTRHLKAKFKVDPQDQEPYLDALEGALQWLDVLRPSLVGEVLVAAVFPMWHDALYRWLLLEDADYTEIGQWFEWWQGEVFPPEIRALPSVVAEFDRGTALIERALDLGDRAKAELKPPERSPALASQSAKSSSSRHQHQHHHKAKQAAAETAAPLPVGKKEEEVTFRHVVEDWCGENDVQFVPERKRVHEQGPLYRITARGDGKGGVLVYFKGDSLVVEAKGKEPVKIYRDQPRWDLLLDMAA